MASYYVWSGATGSGNGSSWANAFTTLTLAFATEAAGDTLYVAHDHSETVASALTLTSSGTISTPTKVVCVNRSGSVPPVSADRRTTAQVATTGGSTINFVGFTHFDGIIFLAGDSTALASINAPGVTGAQGNWQRFDNCSLRIRASGSGNKIAIGATTGGATGCYIEFNNTTVSFAGVSQSLGIAGDFRWRNTASALLNTIPTTLFVPAAGCGGNVECIGVDLSAAGSGKTIVGTVVNAVSQSYRFIDCKLDAAVTKSVVPNFPGAIEVDFIRSGSSGVNYTVFRHRTAGTLDHETTIVRTGGATDGTTPISWKVVTTANCHYSVPFECPVIAIWNDTTGSAKTATIEGIWGSGAVPNDDDVWLDLEYLGDASSPQGSFVNDGKADLLATAAGQASSSATWGGSTTKFKLNVSFTAQQKGWVYARVKCAKPSTTFYLDPLVVLS